MAIAYSDQKIKSTLIPSKEFSKNESGKIMALYFSYTAPVGNQAVGDYVELTDLPDNCRLLGGEIVAQALSTGAGTAGISVGYEGADTRYCSARSVDAATTVQFGESAALNYGDVISGPKVLRAKVEGEAWAAGSGFKGYARVLMP